MILALLNEIATKIMEEKYVFYKKIDKLCVRDLILSTVLTGMK